MIHDWWSGRDDEIYWLEVTDRNDIGANLKAPQTNERGNEFWSYSLLNHVQPGNIVFHYNRNRQAIVAQSVASGDSWEDTVVWAARGQSARIAGIQPHTRPGWYVGLERFSILERPVPLDEIRNAQAELVAQRNQLERSVGRPLYFPFELGAIRPLRPMQGYLFKLPSFFVTQFALLELEGVQTQVRERVQRLGAEYRRADEDTTVGTRDPFSVDPSLVERGIQGHATTQNSLADYLGDIGLEPRSPAPHEPNFDLAWLYDSSTWVAEVKSLTETNEEKQLRLGLGQLLRYSQLLSSEDVAHAVLVTERQPTDASWGELCADLGVLLTWPEDWTQRLLT